MGKQGPRLACVAMLVLGALFIACDSAAAPASPLLASGPFPLWDQIKTEQIIPVTEQVLAEESASLDMLEQDLAKATKDGTLTFDTVFKPYTQIRLRLDAVFGQVDNLASVMDTPALRKAVRAISPSRVAFELRFGQSKEIYNAVNALKTTPALWDKLSAEQQRIVSLTLVSLKNSGVGLAPAQRARFNAIVDKLNKLSTNYTTNVLDSVKASEMLITDKKQLDGVEESTLAVAAQKAQNAGHKGATTTKGPWLITADAGTYVAVVSFAKNRDLRKKVYMAYRTLASKGKSDNTPLINEILTLRKEMAQILGYKNYADSCFPGKMATFDEATSLLQQVANASRPAAVGEEAALTAFARKASGDPQLTLLWWDKPYWGERQKEALYGIKQEQLREYLPLDNVLQGLFTLSKQLCGIDIQPVKQKQPVWQKDVQLYAISNAGSTEPIAYFYTDLFARPGMKQGGAWVMPLWDAAKYRREASPAAKAATAKLKPAAVVAAVSNGSKVVQWTPSLAEQTNTWLASAPKQIPLAIVVSNQNPPADGKPSLMTLNDAETLFHEFGHALQHMLTNTSEGLSSGMRNIEWDAVEVPSQMQEKWVYDNKTFNGFAKHWKTGEPVPAWMFEKIKGMKVYRQGNAFSWQLMLGMTDLQLHGSYDPKGKVTPIQVQHELFNKIMPYAVNPAEKQLNNFGHIFGGGYAAGYYSYMWADVMSADAYAAFEEAGMANDAAISQLGRRFRNTFFSEGGSVPPGEVFKQFRGRAPKIEPLLKYNGLL